MKKTLITAAVVIVIIVFTVWFLSTKDPGREVSSQRASAVESSEPFVVPELGERHTNQKYSFSFAVPEGFSAREFSDDLSGTDYVIIENKKGEGIQIAISPFDDIKILNVATIKNEIPDMKMSDTKTVEIGESHTGVAFISDNPAFGGASREVWFVFKRNLYQISTYERLDGMLREVFSTWQFK